MVSRGPTDQWKRRYESVIVLAALTLVLVMIESCADSPAIPLPSDLAPTSDPRLVLAVEEARRSVAREPDSALAWVRLGHLYLDHKWDSEAALCYRRAVELEPGEFKWRYYLGRCLLTVDDREAEKALARAIELGGEYPPALYYHGEVLAQLGRFEEAGQRFARLVAIDPENPHARLALGQLAIGDRRLEEARQEYERALSRAPDFSEAHAGLAKVCLALGDPQAAARHAELARRASRVEPIADPLWQAVELMSAAPEGFFARAQLYFGAGQTDRGFAELEKVVGGGQNDPEVWLYYASVMFDHRKHDRVVTAMENALELNEGGASRLAPQKLESAHLLLGASFARLGDPRAAERHLLRALELNPRSKVALEELSAIYRGAGRLEESRLLLERAEAAP